MTGNSGKKDGSMKKMRHMMKNGKKIVKNYSEKMVMVGGGFHGMMKADPKKLTNKCMSSTAKQVNVGFLGWRLGTLLPFHK